jgi:hypothetical protein
LRLHKGIDPHLEVIEAKQQSNTKERTTLRSAVAGVRTALLWKKLGRKFSRGSVDQVIPRTTREPMAAYLRES